MTFSLAGIPNWLVKGIFSLLLFGSERVGHWETNIGMAIWAEQPIIGPI